MTRTSLLRVESRARSLDLFTTLVRRELATRYRGTFFGALWPLISQLLQLFVFTYVFSYILKVRANVPGLPESGFAFGAWLFAGLLPWNALVGGVTQSSNSIVANQNTVKKVVFQLIFLPLVPVVACFIEGTIGLPILIVFCCVYFHVLHATAILIWLAWIPQLLLTAGLGLLASAMTVFVRDIPIALTPSFLIFFYMTPIVYPSSIVPSALARLLPLNPIAGIADTYRDLLLTGTMPHWSTYLACVAVSALIFFSGLIVFRHLSGTFADEL